MAVSAADVLVFIVAAVHAGISVVEMFFWNKPQVHRRLAFTGDEARKAAPIVANAGLYNGFLAAGLLWGLNASGNGVPIQMFFLACVIVAGVFGAVTLKWTTLLLQTAPAAVALIFVWMSTVTP
jgi:putative membrane protein